MHAHERNDVQPQEIVKGASSVRVEESDASQAVSNSVFLHSAGWSYTPKLLCDLPQLNMVGLTTQEASQRLSEETGMHQRYSHIGIGQEAFGESR